MKKSREGVRVCMLVWDDKSSLNSSMMGGSGMMATHDEDTRKFFANTGVITRHPLCSSRIVMNSENLLWSQVLAPAVRACTLASTRQLHPS